jgi:hypothetical protein
LRKRRTDRPVGSDGIEGGVAMLALYDNMVGSNVKMDL